MNDLGVTGCDPACICFWQLAGLGWKLSMKDVSVFWSGEVRGYTDHISRVGTCGLWSRKPPGQAV